MIYIYTDGACKGNPGPGGWGALLKYNEHEKEINGFSLETTNNIMELTAVIEALSIIKKKSEITIITDSNYVKDGITKWIDNWKKKGWKIDTNELTTNKGKKAYAIPSPARKTQKGWVLDKVPLS